MRAVEHMFWQDAANDETVCLSMRSTKKNEAGTFVCVTLRTFGWAAQSGATAVDAESGVVGFLENICMFRQAVL